MIKPCIKLNTYPYLRSLRDYDWNNLNNGDKYLADAIRKVCENCREGETK